MVKLEIKKKDLNLVLDKIEECIHDAILYINLDQIKRMITLTHKASYDYQESYIQDLLCRDFFPNIFDAKNYVEKINQGTLEDIEEAFKHLSTVRKVTFAFGGDIDE